MNKAEASAQAWLIEQGYRAEDITFSHRTSPDFVTTDGKGWEVKLLRPGGLTFTSTQLQALRDHPAVMVLVMNKDGVLEAQIPMTDLPELPCYWQDYRIGVVSPPEWPAKRLRPMRLRRKGPEYPDAAQDLIKRLKERQDNRSVIAYGQEMGIKPVTLERIYHNEYRIDLDDARRIIAYNPDLLFQMAAFLLDISKLPERRIKRGAAS